MDETEALELIRKIEDIQKHPPNMYKWSPYDAWLTATNACINQVRIAKNAKNKDTKKL